MEVAEREAQARDAARVAGALPALEREARLASALPVPAEDRDLLGARDVVPERPRHGQRLSAPPQWLVAQPGPDRADPLPRGEVSGHVRLLVLRTARPVLVEAAPEVPVLVRLPVAVPSRDAPHTGVDRAIVHEPLTDLRRHVEPRRRVTEAKRRNTGTAAPVLRVRVLHPVAVRVEVLDRVQRDPEHRHDVVRVVLASGVLDPLLREEHQTLPFLLDTRRVRQVRHADLADSGVEMHPLGPLDPLEEPVLAVEPEPKKADEGVRVPRVWVVVRVRVVVHEPVVDHAGVRASGREPLDGERVPRHVGVRAGVVGQR